MNGGQVEIASVLVCETIRQEVGGQITLVGVSPDRVIHADQFGRIRAAALYVEVEIDSLDAQCEFVWERADGKRILHIEELLDLEALVGGEFANDPTSVARVPIVLHGPASIAPGDYGKTFVKIRQLNSDEWTTIERIEFKPFQAEFAQEGADA